MILRICMALLFLQFLMPKSIAQEIVANTNSISSFQESVKKMKSELSDYKLARLETANGQIDGLHLTILDSNKLGHSLEEFPEKFQRYIKKEMNGLNADEIISRGDSVLAFKIDNVSRLLSVTKEVNKELTQIAELAQGFYMKPSMLGGGGRSFKDFRFDKIDHRWIKSVNENGDKAMSPDAVYSIQATQPVLIITAQHISMMPDEPSFESTAYNSTTLLIKPDGYTWLDRE